MTTIGWLIALAVTFVIGVWVGRASMRRAPPVPRTSEGLEEGIL